MRTLRQVVAVSVMNLHALPSRASASLAAALGIAGTVAVLVAVLAMVKGMLDGTAVTGRDDRAIVLRTGAAGEMTSSLGRQDLALVAQAPGIRRGADGQPLVSAEVLSLVLLTRKDGVVVNAPLRGVARNQQELRPELRIVHGRQYLPAVNEVIVGTRAHAQYAHLDPGDRIETQGATWTVVGLFESQGDLHESEIIADAAALQGALRRSGSFQSVTLALESPAALAGFQQALTERSGPGLEVTRESDYFAEQGRTVTRVLSIVARLVGFIMTLGALVGALNAMYASVGARAVEIATLRAFGFGALPVVASVMMEALVLALVGGLAGVAVTWSVFNGVSFSTTAGGVVGMSRVFDMQVTAPLAAVGLVSAVAIGLLGGLLPALRAARLPPASVLRAM